MKKVLVTGADGFIGSHQTESLLEKGYDVFTTTLSVSPHKDYIAINKIGKELEAKYGVKYLEANFKKNDGYLKSIQNSKLYGIYRQNYCGCKYSIPKQN